MQDATQLHSSIVAMVSMAPGIASSHPDIGQCQLQRLCDAGVPQHRIDAVIEIARHFRDEATHKLDTAFDAQASAVSKPKVENGKPLDIPVTASACCTPTKNGQFCC